jgi:CTP:phosphocholine cytidylyltransferase-like protein
MNKIFNLSKAVPYILVFVLGYQFTWLMSLFNSAFIIDKEQLSGTNLFLLSSTRPFKIYAEQSSDKIDEFAIFKDDKLIFRCAYDNAGQLKNQYIEDGINVVFESSASKNGEQTRVCRFYSDDNQEQYMYLENNNDGVWDVLVNHVSGDIFEWKSRWIRKEFSESAVSGSPKKQN